MRFARRQEDDYSLQLTPLIDVVFLLLIFFMVSTAFVDFTRQMDIELPEANAGASLTQTKVFTIEINKEGFLFLDGKPISVGDLAGKFAQDKSGKKSVILRADKRLNYGLAMEVIGICKNAGINDIGLAVL